MVDNDDALYDDAVRELLSNVEVMSAAMQLEGLIADLGEAFGDPAGATVLGMVRALFEDRVALRKAACSCGVAHGAEDLEAMRTRGYELMRFVIAETDAALRAYGAASNEVN